MKALVSASLALVLCVPLMACNKAGADGSSAPAATNPAEAAEAVQAVEKNILAGFQAKNADQVASSYAQDAVVMIPGEAPVVGHGSVMKSVADDLIDPGFKIDFTNRKTDVAGSGDMAYTQGTFEVSYTNAKTGKIETSVGNYVTVFKKQDDGSWKAVQDISTPGAPPKA